MLGCRLGGRRQSCLVRRVADRGHVGRAGHGRDRSAHGLADRACGRTIGLADRAWRDRSAHCLADRDGRRRQGTERGREPPPGRRRVGHAGAGADPQAGRGGYLRAEPRAEPASRQGGLAVLPRRGRAGSLTHQGREDADGAESCPVPLGRAHPHPPGT